MPQGTRIKYLKPRFKFKGEEVLVNGEPQTSKESQFIYDADESTRYQVVGEDGDTEEYHVNVEFEDELKQALPKIAITVNDGKEIVSKTERVDATLTLTGDEHGGGCEEDDLTCYLDIEAQDIEIRGRGNSSWGDPKKSYQIKFKKKHAVLDMPRAKKWILIANFQDVTMMTEATAFKIARLLEMPFTHNIIPVEVEINGVAEGVYMLTQQKEVRENRIDVGDDGTLMEFTTSKDESRTDDPLKKEFYIFDSDNYNLSTYVRFPKLRKQVDANKVEALKKCSDEAPFGDPLDWVCGGEKGMW